MTISELLEQRQATTDQCLSIYDQLDPTSLDFLKGQWKGYEIKTGHSIEGLLELSGWYGKRFENPENVHPLLMQSFNKKRLFSLNPRFIPLGINFPKVKLLRFIMAILTPILKTKKSKARIRLIEYRGKLTGTMAYDEKGIFDHFVKIDEDTVLGAMDLKGSDKPYFFVLERDHADPSLQS